MHTRTVTSYTRGTMQDTIIIIDRNTAELRKLREMLTREGYSVMTAVDGETARQICRQIPIRFVLGEVSELGFGR